MYEVRLKNILSLKDKHEVLNRISNLEPSARAMWGQMNVNEMVCHLADQLRLGLGIKEAENTGSALEEKFLKWLVLWGLPFPKGKIDTAKELKQGVGGTRPTDFSCDIKFLKDLIEDFDMSFKADGRRHPAFGIMNKKQWGRLAYLHIDYHLKQFGK